MVSCEAIEDRDTLQNSFDLETFELKATQATPGSNKIKLSMSNPTVTGYWNYTIGTSLNNEVEFNYPFLGTAVFTYKFAAPYTEEGEPAKHIEKTIEVEITKIDQAVNPYYSLLAGEAGAGGKTWVFDTETFGSWAPNGDFIQPGEDEGYKPYWYNCADFGTWDICTWDNGASKWPPSDKSGKMVFDLDGGANYTYYASPEAAGVKASFNFEFGADFTKIKTTHKILGEEGSAQPKLTDGFYWIGELTETTFSLYAQAPNWDGSAVAHSVWRFKAVE